MCVFARACETLCVGLPLTPSSLTLPLLARSGHLRRPIWFPTRSKTKRSTRSAARPPRRTRPRAPAHFCGALCALSSDRPGLAQGYKCKFTAAYGCAPPSISVARALWGKLRRSVQEPETSLKCLQPLTYDKWREVQKRWACAAVIIALRRCWCF